MWSMMCEGSGHDPRSDMYGPPRKTRDEADQDRAAHLRKYPGHDDASTVTGSDDGASNDSRDENTTPDGGG
jgi:hypothetical protein